MFFLSKPQRILKLCFVVLLPLAGCGGGGGGSAGANSGKTLEEVLSRPLGEETDCSAVVYSTLTGVPGDQVTLTGLPAEMGEISIRVIAENNEGETRIDPLFVKAGSASGTADFVVPVHPFGDPEGGEVMLEPGDGDWHCPQQSFMIEPLPDAPRDYPLTLAEDIEAWVDTVLEQMGYDPQTLLDADPDTLPKARLGLWLVKQYVSSDRADGLPALAQKAVDENDELLARLLMASGLEQQLNQAINDMSSHSPATLTSQPRPASSARLVRDGTVSPEAPGKAGRPQTQALPAPSDCEAQAFDPDKLQINTASELSARILAAKQGYLFDGSTSGQLLGGAALADVGGSGDAAGWLGVGVFGVATLEAAKRALEPQRITSFTVGRAQQQWIEDRDPSELAFWDQAKVQAEGSSFNISEAMLQSLVTALGMVPGPVGAGTTAATVVSPDGINGAIADLTQDSCVRINAPTYGPINVDDQQWTRAEVVGSTIELAGDGHRQYRGIDIGGSTLEIYLEEQPFALESTMKETFAVEVRQVRTSLIPASARVTQPGEMVQISATATNAHIADNRSNFSATVPSGKGTIIDQYRDGDLYVVEYQTPLNRDDFPVTVEFTAHHRTLPAGSPERKRNAEVDVGGKVTVSPRNACVKQGDTITFTAEIEGFTAANESVSWQASSGTITSTGDLEAVFVAGSNGPVEITATANADSSVEDKVTITVDDHCIRKRWWPAAFIKMDGSGQYSSGGSGTCPDVDNPDEQVELLEGENPPQDIADMLNTTDFWYSRSESIAANFAHTSQRYSYNSDDQQCMQVSLFGSHNANIEYRGESDGTLAASFNSQLSVDCDAYYDGTVECASGWGFMGLGAGMFFLELPEERRYVLEGELSCAGLDGHVNFNQITGTVVRYVNGTPWQPDPQNPTTGVENPNGTMRNLQLFNVTCTQPDQTIPINVDFVLTAPPQGETHQVLIHLTGQLETYPDLFGKEDFGSVPPLDPFIPTAGSYTSSADIDFSVRLRPY